MENEDRGDTCVITFGSSEGQRMLKDVKHKHFEATPSADLLSLIYSAADVTVVTSALESFCLVAAESLACATPVACFNTSGLKDVVIHDQCGYLAKQGDPDDLAYGIRLVTENKENYSRLSKNARDRAVEEFNFDKVATLHGEIYEAMLEPRAQTVTENPVGKTIFNIQQ